MPTSKPSGRVWLVGAGPGDPGLLTFRAAAAIERADVLLYDALVEPAIVDRAPPSCERVYVGKRGGDHAMAQTDIEALMVREAADGKRVVRLKGGDPFVFGRGAEEAETLRAAGVTFEIVPGISSAIAAPAYAGIPVTHRAHNAAFTVVTGHEDPSKSASSLDWAKLADPRRTLVFLMASTRIAEIAEQLIAHGLHSATPAAVVQDGTRPSQRTVTGTLATIAAQAESAQLRAPAVVVVGEVVRLRDRISWFDSLPLFGKRVLVTRPRLQAYEFAAALLECGAEPLVVPLLSIGPPSDPAPAQRAVDEIDAYDWIAFTSRHGVDAFFERLYARGFDARRLGRVRIAAIGPKTSARLEDFGVRADAVPHEFVGEAVARALIDGARRGDRVLIYRAQEARDALPRLLAEASLRVDVVAAYRSSVLHDPDLEERAARADIFTFASAGTVRAFVEAIGGIERARASAAGKTLAYIGPLAAQAGSESGLPVDVVARSYTTNGLVDALVAHFSAAP